MGISERQKEIKRRRHRKLKLSQLQRRVAQASASEKAVIAAKIRRLTPGADDIVARWGLEDR